MVIKIYKLDASPPSRTCMMVAEYLGIPHENIDVNLLEGAHLTPDFIKKNPVHSVPVMEDGDFVLFDSGAIITYLADAYGKDPHLYPNDIKTRARVNAMLFFNTAYLFGRVRAIAFPTIMEGLKKPTEKSLQDIEQSYGYLEEFLTRARWLVGDHMTLADIACAASFSGLIDLKPFDSKKYPKTQAWFEAMCAKPFYQNINVRGAESLRKMLAEKWST